MKFLKYLAIIVFGFWLFTYFAFPTYTHSFRVTFAVNDHGVARTGSSVITSNIKDNLHAPLAQTRYASYNYGISPWVELSDGSLLVIAFRPSYSKMAGYDRSSSQLFISQLSIMAFMGAIRSSKNFRPWMFRELPNQKGRRELPSDQMPQFIWFPNPSDRSSAKIVYSDEFSDILGPNVTLKSVIIEMPASPEDDTSLFKKLPWLEAESKRQSYVADGFLGLVSPSNLIGGGY